jgi:hypothetical protein
MDPFNLRRSQASYDFVLILKDNNAIKITFNDKLIFLKAFLWALIAL